MKYFEFRTFGVGLAASVLMMAACAVDDTDGSGAVAGGGNNGGFGGNNAAGDQGRGGRASPFSVGNDAVAAGESWALGGPQSSTSVGATPGAFGGAPVGGTTADPGTGIAGAASASTRAAAIDDGGMSVAGHAGTWSKASSAGAAGSSVPRTLPPRGGASSGGIGGALATGGKAQAGSGSLGAQHSGGAMVASSITAGAAGFHNVGATNSYGGSSSVGGAVSIGGTIGTTVAPPLGGSSLGAGGQNASGGSVPGTVRNDGGNSGTAGASGSAGGASPGTSGASGAAGAAGDPGSKLVRLPICSGVITPGDPCDPTADNAVTACQIESGGLSETCVCTSTLGSPMWACLGSLVESCTASEVPDNGPKCCPSVPFESTSLCDVGANLPVCLYLTEAKMVVDLCLPEGELAPQWLKIGPDEPCQSFPNQQYQSPQELDGTQCLNSETPNRLYTICPYPESHTTCVCNTDLTDTWACYDTSSRSNATGR